MQQGDWAITPAHHGFRATLRSIEVRLHAYDNYKVAAMIIIN